MFQKFKKNQIKKINFDAFKRKTKITIKDIDFLIVENNNKKTNKNKK